MLNASDISINVNGNNYESGISIEPSDYWKIQSDLQEKDLTDFSQYFTRELISQISFEKASKLSNFVYNGLNNNLADYSDERIEDIEFLRNRGPPKGASIITSEDFNEFFSRDIEKGDSYGYTQNQIQNLLDIFENNTELLDVNPNDIDLVSELILSNGSLFNDYSHEISRVVNHIRDVEVYTIFSNKELSDFINLISSNSKLNNKTSLPEYIFTDAWRGYIFETRSPASIDNTNFYMNIRQNVLQAQEISDHAWSYLENPNKRILEITSQGGFLGNTTFDADFFVEWLITIFKGIHVPGLWDESDKTGPPDWLEISKIPEVKQSLNLMALAYAEHKGHPDVASFGAEMLNTMIGNEFLSIHSNYPYTHRLTGTLTQSSSIKITPDIREALMRISDEELIHDTWLPLPWTRKDDFLEDGSSIIFLDTFPNNHIIWTPQGVEGSFTSFDTRNIWREGYEYLRNLNN